MFFSKKENKKQKSAEPVKPQAEAISDENIHTIPERFYILPKAGLSKKLKIIIISTLAGLIVIAGGVFFSIDWSAKLANQPAGQLNLNLPMGNINTDVVNINNEVVNLTNQAETNTNDLLANANVNINTPANVNANEDEGEDPINEPETPIIQTKPLPASLDSDSDGLTDVEEELYKTNINKPDSDADGYLDGAEVIGGYSPVTAGSKLATSDLVKLYPNPVYRYKLLYPAIWQVSSLDDTGEQIVFRSATKEYVEVITHENPKDLSLRDWYLAMVDKNPLPVKALNDWQMIRTADEQTVYLTQGKGGYIYVITYDQGQLTELNFKSTFEMMLNSFSLVEVD